MLNRALKERPTLLEWEDLCSAQSAAVYVPTNESMREVFRLSLLSGQVFSSISRRAMEKQFDVWHRIMSKPLRLMLAYNYLFLPRSLLLVFAELIRVCTYPLLHRKAAKFDHDVAHVERRRMFRTVHGYIGITPAVAEKGDLVYLIHGCRTPLILRKLYRDRLILVGDCYLHGFMLGDKFEQEKCEDVWLS